MAYGQIEGKRAEMRNAQSMNERRAEGLSEREVACHFLSESHA